MDNSNFSNSLLQAADFLCKLGYNLRERSESVIEKRLSSAEFGTVEDVQKAADKLLLICDVSKKTVDNIKVFLKKALTENENIEKIAQDFPLAVSHDKDSEPRYYSFHYKKCPLRILNKINVKKFTSARVVAQKLAFDTLSKYPVYFDCKLYRSRLKNLNGKISLPPASQNNKGSTKLDSKVDSELANSFSIEQSSNAKDLVHKDQDNKKKRKGMATHIKTKKTLTNDSPSSDKNENQAKENFTNKIKNDEDALTVKKRNKKVISSDSEQELEFETKRKKKSVTSKNVKSKQVLPGSKELAENKNQKSYSSGKMGRSNEKPDDSDNQSSEQQETDKDEVVNLKTLKTNQQGQTSKTDSQQIKVKKSVSGKQSTQDHVMEASSSSSVEGDRDLAEREAEDLPSVTLNGNNTIPEVVRSDLLDESDASSSHNNTGKDKSLDETKKEESADESSKKKRRKAVALSSDSEGGSLKKKDQVFKSSDFEDSDDENIMPAKRSKKKKKASDSDASFNSDEGTSKKKRRRIKTIDDTEESGSESETEGKKHGRKNIRKVMGKNQLEEATKKAAREEKERIARIAERQKIYNNLSFDESGKPDEVVLDKVILDFDPDTKEPLIQVDKGLVKKLKPHQANGIKFMWDACFESVKRIKIDRGSGCILAHCMGLGKTLQVVTLTHTLLTHSDMTGVKRVLIVCPLSTVLNWVNEYNMWLDHAENDQEVVVYEISRHKQNLERANQLHHWLQGGGVCVLGYEMFRNLSADNNKKFRKKMLRTFQEALVDPGPDLVVCDEGHLLKNEKTSLSQSMNRVKTRRRIVLTGTPLQNNLKEYYCMVQFVKPNLLGKYNEYLNRFVNPITNGQYTDSNEHDIKIMKRRSHVLHKMLDGAVQRRDYGVLAPFLPPKHEYVLFITLTDVQIKLYQHYLDNYSRKPVAGRSGFLFPDFQSLQRIWTHPLVLKYNSERYEIMQQKKREREEEDSEGSLADFIDDESTAEETTTDESLDDLSDASDDSRKKSKKKKSSKKNKNRDSKVGPRRGTRANPTENDDDVELVEVKNENPTEWWIKLVEEPELEDLRNSHKLLLLFDILRQCEIIGDKVLLFSQSLYSLDLIEHFLGKIDEATQEGRIDDKLGNHVGSWAPGVDYFRLDGSTSCENRSIWCKSFNREDNPRARLFLISTRAGGLGINLVAANRVVIFDVSWNPSHDVQSIFRVYRFGQKKPCYIYRFLAMGTMEEKIYERQVTKQAISKRVIDEQQIDRHYAENDLAELYKFEPTPPEPRPIPPLPKDRLFAEMLKEHENVIYKYHEHDSLLENKEEETLSEEERKAAWEDFENEKNRPPPSPFPSVWPMHNAGLLAQQQQQLAYTALANVLRKLTPNATEAQIRDMLPLIYNSNPGVMQKLNEIYMQPSMLNHQMMNSMRNTGGMPGSVGAGMASSSNLLYEPPWQRQQHMMQQNVSTRQMNPKYYVGGLGSRDPVEMMLQNQFSRSMGEASRGRPRGRPPSTPRAPPAAMPQPSDIVNLDSD